MKKIYTLFLIFFVVSAYAQKVDTIHITARDLNTKALIPGMHQWLVYFKNGKDSARTNFSIWNRNIELIDYQGKEAIAIRQFWESDKAVVHKAYSVVDRKTFAPFYHEISWKGRGEGTFDFTAKKMTFNGAAVTAESTNEMMAKMYKAFDQATKEYELIWHLDLETFPLLPYKDHTAFVINFYDPGFPTPPKPTVYTVVGSGVLKGLDGQNVECWKLAHGNLPENYEVFWISKKTKEVLKLDQEFNGKYRYKIKLTNL